MTPPLTDEQKDALYRRFYCNRKGDPAKGVRAKSELDDEDFERMARLANFEDRGSKPQIPGVSA